MNKPLTQIQTICQHGIALAEKATPGPKHVDQSGQGDERFWLIADVMRDRYGNNSISGEDEPTIQFIAQAFTLLPAALTALQEAVAALDQAIKVLHEEGHPGTARQFEQWQSRIAASLTEAQKK